MTEPHHETHVVHHGSDMGAGIAGFLIGAVVLLLILGTIVKLTSAHYAKEKPAAAAQG